MKGLTELIRKMFLLPITFYRKYLSGMKASPTCRFTPTCSAYAYKAINEWGVIIGMILGAYRLLRCNPLCRCGEDNIPHRKRKFVPKTEVFDSKTLRKKNKRYKIFFYTNILD